MSGVSKQLINLLVNSEKIMFRINVGVFKPGEQRFTLNPGSSANPHPSLESFLLQVMLFIARVWTILIINICLMRSYLLSSICSE